MGASVSVQRISTSTMKVLVIISLLIAYVAARGSGPYLPSGWKPDGPAFNLPSEVSKPSTEPEKDVIFSESEASGSDFLREYGPPKVQEIAEEIYQQGLPDVVNEKLFIETKIETNYARNLEAEVETAEEHLTTTESLSVTATESIANIKEANQVNDATVANVVEFVKAVDEFGYLVEPTIAIVVATEEVATEVSGQSEDQVIGNTVVETQQLTRQQPESNQLIRQAIESEKIDAIQSTSRTEQSSTDVSEPTELSSVESSRTSTTQQANFDVISVVEEKVKEVEKVSKVEKIVQNIPEVIVNLENEIKSKQSETIQEVPGVVQDIIGPLDQAPEGFLEYGPPGFREYGPPKEDLTDNTIEEKIPEINNDIQTIENSEIRLRRFSPKFRSSQESQ